MNNNEEYNKLVAYITSLNPLEFAAAASLFGFLLSAPLNAKTQQTVGNFFELIGQVMLTISSQAFIYEDEQNPND